MLCCSLMRLASHVLRVKNVVFKGQIFVVWIDLPAIETRILVEIGLQVYIFAHKVGFTVPKEYFFIFCRFLDETRKSRGNANFACFSLATQFVRIFSLATLELQFFLTEL